MFEEYTFEYLMKSALARVGNDVDKRQGSIIYDALAPACAELCQAYIQLDRVIAETFADTASREYLIKRAKERGLEPKEATNAIVLAELKGDFKLEEGAGFNYEAVNYYYLGEKEGEYFKLKCESKGEAGNNTIGSLIPIDNISGLESAEIVGLFYEGEEEEETEVFRKRYFESFESQAFGGNIADYKEKMEKLNEENEITNNGGVGGVKVYPVWNGGGSVKLVFTSKGYNKPTESLVSLVQERVMPKDKEGEGVGFAPIGHNVTVEAVQERPITVEAKLRLKNGYGIEDIKGYVEEVIESYFEELRKKWGDSDSLEVIISKINSGIIDIVVNDDSCIKDVKETVLNGSSENAELLENEIPVLSSVSLSLISEVD